MKRLLLVAIAASAVLSSGAAFADDNTVNIDQSGNDNTAYINQVGSNNSVSIIMNGANRTYNDNNIGTEDNPILQQGSNNTFIVDPGNYYQYGDLDLSNNDIVAARQIGDNNYFHSILQGSAKNSLINSITQQNGNNNSATVFRKANSGSVIDTIIQDGGYNSLSVLQWNGANYVGTVRQVGSDNGHANGEFIDPQGGGYTGIYVLQDGEANSLDESSIYGSNNADGHRIYGTGGHHIRQIGTGNGNLYATAITYGSESEIDVRQTGDYNNFYLTQGDDVYSSQNEIGLVQTGDDNAATVSQGSFDNFADLTQDGVGNTIDLMQTVSSNSATISQTGNGNTTTLTQTGSGNVAVITQ